MVKKKKEISAKDLSDKFRKSILKDLGLSLDKLSDLKTNPDFEYYSTGFFALDQILNGGVGKGDLVEIYGPEMGGKTTIALQIAGEWIRTYGLRVLFLDFEQGLDLGWTRQFISEDEDKYFVRVRPQTAEEGGELIRRALLESQFDAVVIDSIASMTPIAVYEGVIGKQPIGIRARSQGIIFDQLKGLARLRGVPILCINQRRIKMRGLVAWEDSACGNALRHMFSTRLSVKILSWKTEGKEKKRVGCEVLIEVKKHKHGSSFNQAKLIFVMNKGFKKVDSLFSYLYGLGHIVQAGGYFSFLGKNWRGGDLLKKSEKFYLGYMLKNDLISDKLKVEYEMRYNALPVGENDGDADSTVDDVLSSEQ